MNLTGPGHRRLRSRTRLPRRALVGLVAGASVAAVALPAHAVPGPPRAARHASVAAARPLHPGPLGHHPLRHRRDVAARSLATVTTQSKRDGGHTAIAAPAAYVVLAPTTTTRTATASARPARMATTVAARAPPAGQ